MTGKSPRQFPQTESFKTWKNSYYEHISVTMKIAVSVNSILTESHV
jgi:hypothetical protein